MINSTTFYKILSTLLVTGLFCLSISAEAKAQSSSPSIQEFQSTNDTSPPAPPQPPGNAPVQTPIDGGLGLLLAAGGIYAVRRLKKNKEV